jgi:cysteine synthase A
MAIHDSILDTIGSTPIVKLHRIAPAHVTLYAKVEAFNPGGSVKDRLALAIVLDAEQNGLLKPGQTIVEATSGNTGIALAMVAAARGYPFVAVMTETFSIERRKLMRAYGAKVILTPAAERGTGMVRKAKELAEKHGWFLARQFENPRTPPGIAAPRRLKSCATSPASGSTTSSAAGAPAARSPEWERCCAWLAPK